MRLNAIRKATSCKERTTRLGHTSNFFVPKVERIYNRRLLCVYINCGYIIYGCLSGAECAILRNPLGFGSRRVILEIQA